MALTPYLGPVKTVQDLARVCGEGGENFGTATSHAHETDRGFRVGLCLVLEYQVGGVCLGLPPRRHVVAVSAALTVVYALAK